MTVERIENGVIVQRNTKEIEISITLDTVHGKLEGSTGVNFFDHLLNTFCHYSGLGLRVSTCESKDGILHHLIEDFGISLGQAFRELFDYTKVRRFGEATVPMNEALIGCYVDLSGRPFFQKNFEFSVENIEDMPVEGFEEFMNGFVNHARITVHFFKFFGKNDHHISESAMKSFGLAIARALERSDTKTTKGVID
ncbi:imidazoleglycerol-phosphate dehydratase [Thermotoga sp. SG1]|uniref:imidazoleglycerol-phosphate dehydratase n=1 Tax=Thermotoga sp. SG1 TaxID=126739 RepID=UPI000C7798F3|nr:imidazoleglycerol-phosphate dehydratase [Thermotoga sp. SG1]PLV56078.1 imidazoleglycerol-phosphate dehydratase [Thermotoga sp. SG1]